MFFAIEIHIEEIRWWKFPPDTLGAQRRHTNIQLHTSPLLSWIRDGDEVRTLAFGGFPLPVIASNWFGR